MKTPAKSFSFDVEVGRQSYRLKGTVQNGQVSFDEVGHLIGTLTRPVHHAAKERLLKSNPHLKTAAIKHAR